PATALAQQDPPARDIIRELGVRPCINAAGTYTALTGSLMPPEVVAGIQVASRQYVRLNELHDAVGKRIAELLKSPAAMVSAGCASALTLATAACVAGDDPEGVKRIPDTAGMKSEVLVQRTHRVGYDHAIRNAGGPRPGSITIPTAIRSAGQTRSTRRRPSGCSSLWSCS